MRLINLRNKFTLNATKKVEKNPNLMSELSYGLQQNFKVLKKFIKIMKNVV